MHSKTKERENEKDKFIKEIITRIFSRAEVHSDTEKLNQNIMEECLHNFERVFFQTRTLRLAKLSNVKVKQHHFQTNKEFKISFHHSFSGSYLKDVFHKSKELNHETGRDRFQETGPPTQSVGGGNSQGSDEGSLELPWPADLVSKWPILELEGRDVCL